MVGTSNWVGAGFIVNLEDVQRCHVVIVGIIELSREKELKKRKTSIAKSQDFALIIKIFPMRLTLKGEIT